MTQLYPWPNLLSTKKPVCAAKRHLGRLEPCPAPAVHIGNARLLTYQARSLIVAKEPLPGPNCDKFDEQSWEQVNTGFGLTGAVGLVTLLVFALFLRRAGQDVGRFIEMVVGN